MRKDTKTLEYQWLELENQRLRLLTLHTGHCREVPCKVPGFGLIWNFNQEAIAEGKLVQEVRSLLFLLFLLQCLWGCMCICMHMYGFMSACLLRCIRLYVYRQLHVEARERTRMSSSEVPPPLFKTSLIGLESTSQARLSGEWNPKIFLSLPLKNQDHKHTLLCLAFLCEFWRLNLVSHIFQANAISSELSPQPVRHFCKLYLRVPGLLKSSKHCVTFIVTFFFQS